MSIVKKLLYTSYIWSALKACLLGAQFTFPEGTPGLLQADENIINCEGDVVCCKKVRLNLVNTSLYFPINGQQPHTFDVREWSGAKHIGEYNDKVITDWWLRIFGGAEAVGSTNDGHVALMNGFDAERNPKHIICVNGDLEFWQMFRIIAENPVGRVLLYRLLIEIRRVDEQDGSGCCEDGIMLTPPFLNYRNKCRSLTICFNENSSFNFKKAYININPGIKQHSVLSQNDGFLTTVLANRTGDISLFHELLHWFHYLRNPQRISIGNVQYVTKFYYDGQIDNVWGTQNLDKIEEEIATILGIPNYNNGAYHKLMPQGMFPLINDGVSFPIKIGQITQYIPNYGRYLNGYDLSENAYRCAKSETAYPKPPTYMRFGHISYENMNPVVIPPIPNRFQLAHRIAKDCFLNITGMSEVLNWNLKKGQAIR